MDKTQTTVFSISRFLVKFLTDEKFRNSRTSNGLVWKMVNTWPPKKNILGYPLSKIGVFGFLISWIFRKKQRNKKKLIFGQFSLFLFRLSC